MPWVLRIESGSRKGETVPFESSAPLRVGRTAKAELALPKDTFLSGVHFEVVAEEDCCVLRDVNSSNGTFFLEARIRAVRLSSGDSFTAGQTRFTVQQQIAPEPAAAAPDIEALLPGSREALLTAMRTNLQPLYAVLDASRDPRVLGTLVQHKAQYAWLFEPGTPPELMPFAPYLVPLAAGAPALEALIDMGWTQHWGIYLTSAASPWELFALLKRLLLVEQPDGQQVLLRFYDPRVLRPLLDNALPWQWPFLFGAVQTYLLPGEEPQTLTAFAQGSRGIEKSEVYLGEPDRKAVVVLTGASAQNTRPFGARDRLTLASQQTGKMKARQREPFLESLLKETRERYPERFFVEGQGEEWVQYGCQRPQRYGISAEGDVRTYVLLTMQLGRNFDTDLALPWAGDTLGRRMPPEQKLARLQELAAEHLLMSQA